MDLARRSFTAEQIVGHLRQAEIKVSEGRTVREAIRQIGVKEQRYYRWRKEYGGMDTSQAQRLKDLEKENQRLKRIVADQALDVLILKAVNRRN
jgi:putative transposase